MKFYFLLLSFCFSVEHFVITIDEDSFSLQDFYSFYPKNQWLRADSLKKEQILNDFLERQLTIMDAKTIGLANDPETYVKIYNRSKQLLINETYESLVAEPLIKNSDLLEAKQYAKKELLLHHILIGHKESYLGAPPARSIDEALLLSQQVLSEYNNGALFADLAVKYSDDPSVHNNLGSLGWVEWGLTASSFQSAAFKLNVGDISSPTLTPFGYHLIFVENIQSSDYDKMSKEEFNNSIINLSKRSIREKLRGAALAFDSTALVEHRVIFNTTSINKIVSAYNKEMQQESSSKNINIINLMGDMLTKDVIFVRKGFGYGPMWFANKLKGMPSSRHPVLDSESAVVEIFKHFILQDIALINGKKHKITDSFSYKKRQTSAVSAILYDAYLKFTLNSITPPDSSEIKKYYENNKNEKYLSLPSYLVEELRFRSKIVADSIFNIVSVNENFTLHKNDDLFIVYNDNLLIKKSTHPKLYDAAILLDKNLTSISPVLSSFGGNYSIIKINKYIPPTVQEYSKVYSRIEALLLKNKKEHKNNNLFDSLIKKYKVEKNISILP